MLFHKIGTEGTLFKLSASNEAIVILIPKPHKDPTKKENYRPFSNQIQKHVEKIICHDEVDFIPEMQGQFNKCKLINVIHHMNKLKDKIHMIISLVA